MRRTSKARRRTSSHAPPPPILRLVRRDARLRPLALDARSTPTARDRASGGAGPGHARHLRDLRGAVLVVVGERPACPPPSGPSPSSPSPTSAAQPTGT